MTEPSLIIRPSGVSSPEKAWALQLRYHDLGGVEYVTIGHVSLSVAREVLRAGEAYWLFGEPKENPAADECAIESAIRLSRLADLKAERAQLIADNEKAAAWGAAVAARSERIAVIERDISEMEGHHG